MPTGLRRFQQNGDLHAINFKCFRGRKILDTAEARDTFLQILEETRQKYQFRLIGYVVMPTHVHLLLSEREIGLLSTVMQVIKQRFSRTRIEQEVWEMRYYDFNIHSPQKRAEKLEYMHDNPVRAGIVIAPGDWAWSSYRAWAGLEPGPVTVSVP